MTIIKNNIKGKTPKINRKVKIGIVKSTYNPKITDVLEQSCIKELKKAGVSAKNIWTLEIPGAYELPFGCQRLIKSKKVDAVIALGAIIKGQTPHFDFIAKSASIGIMDVSLKTNIPVIFGVLTTNNISQAKDRIKGGKRGDKGIEAVRATLKMLNI